MIRRVFNNAPDTDSVRVEISDGDSVEVWRDENGTVFVTTTESCDGEQRTYTLGKEGYKLSWNGKNA